MAFLLTIIVNAISSFTISTNFFETVTHNIRLSARFLLVNFMAHRNALIVCGLFLLVGVVVLDDYGMSQDDEVQRAISISTVKYVMGNDAFLQNWNRYYGVAFELPLLFFEFILGLDDSRSIYLSRHLLTHLFFLVGGFFCYLLAYRLFNNRLMALFAMLLFLLHPRMYAHSFINTKDIPFLSMFMIALFLIDRGFRKDTVWAFLLCGVGIGILTNIRILGLMLFVAVLAMRAFDFFYATGREERKHVLITTRGFTLAGVLTLYATWPYLWSDPVGHFIESVTRMAHYPNFVSELFQGERLPSTDLPFYYIPTWFSITTPPVTLLFGIIGLVSIFCRGITHPGDILRNTPLRFRFLLIACFILPVLVVVLLHSTLYDGWRQMYFLYAPFCVLAVFGLHWLVSFFKQKPLRAGIYGLVGAGVCATVVSMILIHPFQQIYFNFLVDKRPGYLEKQYELDYWAVGILQALRDLLEQYPSSPIYVTHPHVRINRNILPKADRERIFVGTGLDRDSANFYVLGYFPEKMQELFIPSMIHKYSIYNSDRLSVAKMNLSRTGEDAAEVWRKTYRSAVSRNPLFRSNFDVYFNENERTLTYIKESCRADDIIPTFLLHVFPVDPNDLTDEFRQYGYGSYHFFFREHGVIFDGKCVVTINLPKYRIARVRTGQYLPYPPSLHVALSRKIWMRDIPFLFDK